MEPSTPTRSPRSSIRSGARQACAASAPRACSPALQAAFDCDPLLVRGVGELSVVGVVLVGVGDGEALEGTVEGVLIAEVAGDLRRVAAAGVGARERGAADLGVARQALRWHPLDHGGAL